jgi:hypothetical protein
MSKNPSERNQTPSDRERAGRQQQEDQGQGTNDRNKQPERHRESMGRKQAGQKFVSDEDIVKRRTE